MLYTADELKMEKQRCIKRSQERGSQTQKQAGGQARATEGTVARRGLAARASPFGLPDGDRRGGCLGSPPRPLPPPLTCSSPPPSTLSRSLLIFFSSLIRSLFALLVTLTRSLLCPGDLVPPENRLFFVFKPI